MMALLGGITAIVAAVGVGEALAGWWLVMRFVRKPAASPRARPAVTALKPLHGDEPLLEVALATLCRQDYPKWQIVFGVQDAHDPAIAVVRRIKARFPDCDIALVIDPTQHGRNRKVGNLINMLPAARHDVLVIADSDVHARTDYLNSLLAALERPGVGLVTTLYAGLPVNQREPRTSIEVDTASRSGAPTCARLGATQITHGFLPGALLARALGRKDCLGATMCLRRSDLARIGGLRALVDHLADDNVLGQRIAALGLGVALADTVPLTTVPETSLGALFRHELRWARTIRALEPWGFAASVAQYPLAWGLMTVLLSGGALWSVGLFLACWMLRAMVGLGLDRALAPMWFAEGPDSRRSPDDAAALAFSCPTWLLPLRDILSVAVMLASYGGRQVDWRGHGLQADTPPPSTQQPAILRL